MALVAALLLAGGCASTQTDETVGWSAQRLYGEAKDAMVRTEAPMNGVARCSRLGEL